jgi:hypothetical protein
VEDMAEKTYTLEEIKKLKSKTDNERIKKITEEEIEKSAKEDPDSALPTDEELKKFKRVNPHDKK